ncbi:hypothetical protein AAG570_002796 [Ranatra chinensis]|uniref:RING-type domain-containing protein n=1 Tax=Ranatra chinensis TaxID=642074 RepID=A0ABD0Y4Z2_9HEMI
MSYQNKKQETTEIGVCNLPPFVIVRCITLMILPSSLTKIGNAPVKAFLLASILNGPIDNMMKNSEESVRSFTCTIALMSNLTKTRYSLAITPFQRTLHTLQGDTDDVYDSLSSIGHILSPLKEEFEGKQDELDELKAINDYVDRLQGDTARSDFLKGTEKEGENKTQTLDQAYMRKFQLRCQNIVSSASLNCRKIFYKNYDKCYDAVTWVAAWLVCWPMKLSFICNIVQTLGGDEFCNPENVLSKGVGPGFQALSNTTDLLRSEFNRVYVKYDLNTTFASAKKTLNQEKELTLNVYGPLESRVAIYKIFLSKKSYLLAITEVVKLGLILYSFSTVQSAQKFHNDYLTNLNFQNFYITRYFKKIDARRYKAAKRNLLPLKHKEKREYVDKAACKMSTLELSDFELVIPFVEFFIIIVVCVFDYMFYEVLLTVKEYAAFSYEQKGTHDFQIVVKGSGFVASMIKNLVAGFNVKRNVDVISNNKGTHKKTMCLPEPTRIPNRIVFNLVGSAIAITISNVFSGYFTRINTIILEYYYPTDDLNFLIRLRLGRPRIFGWLKYLKWGKRKCLICANREGQGGLPYHECKDCRHIYCSECWNDISRVCYLCHVINNIEDNYSDPGSDIVID